MRAESLGGRKVRQRIPSGFREKQAEAPFRPQKRDYQARAWDTHGAVPDELIERLELTDLHPHSATTRRGGLR